MFVSALRAVIQRDILSRLIKLQAAGGRQPLNERGLTTESMRKLICLKHGLRVNAGGLGQACIQNERGSTNSLARLIGELQQVLFNSKFIFNEGNIGSLGGGRLQRAVMRLSGALDSSYRNQRLQA